ncbi:MAG TPA: Clp protease N-terminal domain-containing protein [Oculatellaceae cyanobacterium]
MAFEGLSAETIEVLVFAANEASRQDHVEIGTDHLLIGLLLAKKSVVAKTLTSAGLNVEAVRNRLIGERKPKVTATHSPELTAIIDQAAGEARNLNSQFMCPEHLLLAICFDSSCRANKALAANDLRGHDVSSALLKALNKGI